MTTFKINISNVLQVKHSPISCLALNEEFKRIALYRNTVESPSIELWDISHLPFLEGIFTHLEEIEDKPSVEGLAWAQNRLFSCGLHGFIVEHNLATKRIKNKSAATSGPVWCISVNSEETHLAAGTEDGFINIFEISQECLIYLKVLDRQEGRVLSLAWSPCGQFISTGSVDSVRLWDLEKGHALQRLLTGRSKNKETIVWTVIMLDKFTIVSGDSRGIVSFWDAKLGVLKFRLNTHKADILTLKANANKSQIYVSGVDPLVVILEKVSDHGSEKWVRSHQRNLHTNDVMCLATLKNKLYSAGVDGHLVVSSYPPKVVSKYPPLPRASKIHFSSQTGLILIQNPRSIELWSLPNGDYTNQTKLVQLTSRKNQLINSSDLSPNGSYFVYSTPSSRINLFRLSTTAPGSECSPQLTKCSLDESFLLEKCDDEGGMELLDSLDSISLWSVHFLNERSLIALSGDLPSSPQLALTFTIHPEENSVKVDSYFHLPKKLYKKGTPLANFGAVLSSISGVRKQLALSDREGGVTLLYLEECSKEDSQNQYKKLAGYDCQASTLVFHPEEDLLLVSYVDHTLRLFDTTLGGRGRILLNGIVGGNLEPEHPILGGSWRIPYEENSIFLYDADRIYLVEISKEEDQDGPTESKKSRNRKSGVEDGAKSESWRVSGSKSTGNKYKFIASAQYWSGKDELVGLEVRPGAILNSLPPAFAKKRFGGM